MSTDTTVRCEHCFTRVPADQARDLYGENVCDTCAHLAMGRSANLPLPIAPGAGPPGDATVPAPGDATVMTPADPAARDFAEAHEYAARQTCSDGGAPRAPTEASEFWKPLKTPHPLLAGEGNVIGRLIDDLDRWCQGRWWHIRTPALLFFAFTWIQHAGDSMYQSMFKGLNLGIHELGHYVFGPIGDLMGAWGGSLLQCLIPIIAMAMFLKQRDYFAIAFAWGWLGTNFFEVSTYVADAVRMELPLVTPGGGHAIHDWNYILGDLGWLMKTQSLAELHRTAGHASFLVCLIMMSCVLWKMLRSASKGERPTRSA